MFKLADVAFAVWTVEMFYLAELFLLLLFSYRAAIAQKITNPACKYGVPLTVRRVGGGAKKPPERKAAVKHKPVSVLMLT